LFDGGIIINNLTGTNGIDHIAQRQMYYKSPVSDLTTTKQSILFPIHVDTHTS